MALVQPTNLFPSSFRGSGGDVIDASVANTFSLQLNGSSPCVAYSIKIMQNNAASTVVYSTAKTTLSPAIYPRDYTNTPQRLEIVVPATSVMTNGYANGYKWNVTLWWDSTHTITSADTFFKCEATPYFTVVNAPTTVTEKSVTLTATYTQTDDVPLEWYRWTISDSDGNIVADTGEVFSEDIRITADGLLNGESFTYVVVGETQSATEVGGIDDGQGGMTNAGEFTVAYDAPIVRGAASVSCDSKTGAIRLSFPSIRIIEGTATGTYQYEENTPIDGDTSINLPSSASLTFNQVNGAAMALPADVTHIWSGTPSGDSTLYTYVEGSGFGAKTGRLSYSGIVLSYSYNGQTLVRAEIDEIASKWIIAVMRGRSVTIQVWEYSTLYPSDNLYPSNTVYPGAGAQWRDAGRFTEDIYTMVIAGTVVGTISVSNDTLTFNITNPGEYQMMFYDPNLVPIAEAIDETVTTTAQISVPIPSTGEYIINCTLYQGGRYMGASRFYMNYPSGDETVIGDSEIISSISLGASSKSDYIKLVSGSMSAAEKEEYLDIMHSDSTDSFDGKTVMFAKFDGNLEAGNYSTGGETIVGWDIYKQKTGASNIQFVASVPTSQTAVVDCLIENAQSYTYYLFPLGLSVMGSPIVSDPVTSRVWNWVLFTAQESANDKNVLNVTGSYVFQGNVETGTISNNAQSSVLHNFTKYPKIIKGTQNYKSGKLSALVGYIDTVGNTYTETSELRDALLALSTSEDRMFVKNRAGDIWEVSIHESVSMDVKDTSPMQPHTASVEWTEVAPVRGISLIAESEV